MAKILVLGSGMVGSAISLDLAARHQVLATDASPSSLQRLEGAANIQTQCLDVTSTDELQRLAKTADLVVCAVPGFLGYSTLQHLIEIGTTVADISFFPEEALDLDYLAKANGAVVVCDIGVAPGLDNLIFGHHDAQMEVRRFECLVGGLPKQRDLPWQYKAPFSPMDVIEEYLRPARLMRGGKEVVMPALSEPEMVDFSGVGTLEAFNTDGLRSLLRTMSHVPDMCEKTLRYPGHRDLIWALRESGFLAEEPVVVDGQQLIPRQVTSAILFHQWKLQPEEEEITVMRVTVEGLEQGVPVRHVWHLHDTFDIQTKTASMSRTTGYTCTGMVDCLLDEDWNQAGVATGEIVGGNASVFSRILSHLQARGVTLNHQILH